MHVQAWSHFADARAISEVVFAVVDVEGHEASVIRGMSLETRSTTFPVFTFELGASWVNFKNSGNWTQRETASYLARLGYELFLVLLGLTPEQGDGGTTGQNFQACPQGHRQPPGAGDQYG